MKKDHVHEVANNIYCTILVKAQHELMIVYI
jgi:hypothetical protein